MKYTISGFQRNTSNAKVLFDKILTEDERNACRLLVSKDNFYAIHIITYGMDKIDGRYAKKDRQAHIELIGTIFQPMSGIIYGDDELEAILPLTKEHVPSLIKLGVPSGLVEVCTQDIKSNIKEPAAYSLDKLYNKNTIGELTRHPLVIIGVAAILFIAFYFFASPFQNCIRGHSADTASIYEKYCSTRTSW